MAGDFGKKEINLRVNNEHQQTETTEPNTKDTLHQVRITSDIQEEHQSVDNMTAEEELRGSSAEEPQEEVSPDLDVVRDRIQEVMQSDQRVGLPSLRSSALNECLLVHNFQNSCSTECHG